MQDKKRFRTETFRGQPLVMRLINNDMLAIEEHTQKSILRIQLMSAGKICLCPHYEANVDARNRDKEDIFIYKTKTPGKLKQLSARKITVTMLGQVKDPGFKEDDILACPSKS